MPNVSACRTESATSPACSSALGGIQPRCREGPPQVGPPAGGQQRLGGDTPAVQEGPADLVLLDQADAHAELGRTQGTGVAAAPAAKDEDVESRCGVRHGLPPKNQATPRIAR